VHPAKLLSGLAAVVEGLGVPIYESTPVREVRRGEAITAAGSVRARWVVCATEGYTASLRGRRRALVPLNSSMIITEPLTPGAWEQIGWQAHEVMSDHAHVYAYLQRTADGRIAIGGRGIPYHFGSRTDGEGEIAPATVASLRRKLAQMLPPAGEAPLAHASAAAAPATSSGSVLRIARASTKAPPSEHSIEIASRRARGREMPAAFRRSLATAIQPSNTSAHAARIVSLVLDTSSATVAIG